MSLHSFKETLRPCPNLSSADALSSSSFSSSQPSISHQFDLPTNPRKPPKSSLSQQLLRLQDPLFAPQLESQSQRDHTQVEDEAEDGVDERKEGFGRPKLDSFQFDHTGPFEPLVLSAPGDAPVVQVPASVNCRLLEHQRAGVKFLYNLYKNNHGGVLGDDM